MGLFSAIAEWWRVRNLPENVEKRHMEKLARMERQAEYLEKRAAIEVQQAKLRKIRQSQNPVATANQQYPGMQFK